jgi:HPt (histidine-containing phosphotransfer) domain-containing protein
MVQFQVEPDLLDLVPEYLQKRRQELAQVSELLRNKDFATLKRIGHQMKGNAALFGLGFLGEKGAELEGAARSEQEELILKVCQDMKRFIDEVVGQFPALEEDLNCN